MYARLDAPYLYLPIPDSQEPDHERASIPVPETQEPNDINEMTKSPAETMTNWASAGRNHDHVRLRVCVCVFLCVRACASACTYV